MDIINLILSMVLNQAPEPGTVFEPAPVVQYDDVPPTQEPVELETGGGCWLDNTCEANDDGETIEPGTDAVIPGVSATVPDEFPEGFLTGDVPDDVTPEP